MFGFYDAPCAELGALYGLTYFSWKLIFLFLMKLHCLLSILWSTSSALAAMELRDLPKVMNWVRDGLWLELPQDISSSHAIGQCISAGVILLLGHTGDSLWMFWLLQLDRCYWYLVGGGQECYRTFFNAQCFCGPGVNPIWSWGIILLMPCRIWFTTLLFTFFSIYTYQGYQTIVYFFLL